MLHCNTECEQKRHYSIEGYRLAYETLELENLEFYLCHQIPINI